MSRIGRRGLPRRCPFPRGAKAGPVTPKPRGGEGGFTLVEIMLAMLLTGIVMALVSGVVLTTIQAQQRIEQVTRATEIGPAIMSQIRADLDGSFLPRKAEEGFVGINRQGSGGDRDRIDFIATTIAFGSEEQSMAPRFHSVNELGYQVRENPNDTGVGILYRREDYFIDQDPMRGGRLIELYERVTHFDVRYWDGETWVEEWNNRDTEGTLPRAVRVELKILVSDREDPNRERSYVTTVTFPEREPPIPEAPPDEAASQ